LDAAYKEAKRIILEYRDQLELMTQMLIEFETLDAEDVQKIINKEWNVEEKRARLKKADELHKKNPIEPPPSPFEKQPGKGSEQTPPAPQVV
jgi:cell division protease FtsH